MTDLSALAACTISESGSVLYAKSIHDPHQTASTMKLLTCYTARKRINIRSNLTISTADQIDPLWSVQNGDVLSYSDAIHLTILQSNNVVARAIGRTVGQLLLNQEGDPTGNPMARMYAEMTRVGYDLGWSGHVVNSAFGGSGDDRLSAWQLCDLIRRTHENDPWLYGVAGKDAHSAIVSGPRDVFINVTHTLNSYRSIVPVATVEAGKTGTGNANQQSLVIGWLYGGRRYFSAVVNSSDRTADMTTMLNAVIAAHPARRGASSVAFL